MFGWTQKGYDQNIKLSLNAPVIGAVVTAATYGAGNIPINGSAVTKDKVTLPSAQTVNFISAGNDENVLWYIAGFNDGIAVSEYLQGANVGTATTVNQYEDITETMPTGANTASTVTVGITGNATAVCASQSGTVGTPLLLNGTDVAGVYLNPSKPSYIQLTCAANETGNTITLYGNDISGKKYIYPLPGVNAGTQIFEIPFSTVYAATCSVTCSGNISLDTTNQTATPWCPIDDARDDSDVGIYTFVEPGSTLSYHVEWTWENIQSLSGNSNVVPFAVANDVNIPSGTTTSATTSTKPCLKGVRAVIDEYTEGALFLFLNQSAKRSQVGG